MQEFFHQNIINIQLLVPSRLHNSFSQFFLLKLEFKINKKWNNLTYEEGSFSKTCQFFSLHWTLTSNFKFEACLEKNRSTLDEKENDCSIRRPISNLCVYFDFFFFIVTLDDRVLCELALSLIELALTLFVNEFQPLDAIILKRVTVNFY